MIENNTVKIFDRENNLVGFRYNGETRFYKNDRFVSESFKNLTNTIMRVNKIIENHYKNT